MSKYGDHKLYYFKSKIGNIVFLMIADWCLKCHWTYVVISIPLGEREQFGSVSKLHDYILNYFINQKFNIVFLMIADGCLKYLYSKSNGSFISRAERERSGPVSMFLDYILYYCINKTDKIVFFMIANQCLKVSDHLWQVQWKL